MGKAAAPRALPENEAKAVARMLRVSPQKLWFTVDKFSKCFFI